MTIGSGVDVAAAVAELRELGARQWAYEHEVVNLIASDNALPAELTANPVYPGHMIQEGLAGRRPFAGARLHDEIEQLAERLACAIFGADAANLQPHSCSQANQAAYHALLEPGDPVLSLNFQAGGHLTHGLRINFSGRIYRFHNYGLGADERIDYDRLEELAEAVRPRLIVCGSSSYPRLFDAERLRAAADGVGALLMFDLSHEAGLIAGGAIPNPVPLADVATMSLDKTLRGPFGAVILANGAVAADIGRAVHPGTQSSFSVRRLADSAHALALTQTDRFTRYARGVIENARSMAARFQEAGARLVTGGTDKHYLVLDVRQAFGLSGQTAEEALEAIGVLASRQSLPEDASARGSEAGGLRLGAAWATSRGYDAGDFEEIALIVLATLRAASGGDVADGLADRVRALARAERPDDVWRRP
jgi:glycine hydroxymethyltransferase